MTKFESHTVTKEQGKAIEIVRKDFSVFWEAINHLIPEGREKSLTITKLEEACMWAIKGISRENIKEEEG